MLAAVLALALPVQASSWLECEVQARLLDLQEAPDGEPHPARIRVLESVVSDGMAAIGSDCFEPGRELEIALTLPAVVPPGAAPVPGARVHLEYRHYSAMGPQGPVSRTTWRLLPSP